MQVKLVKNVKKKVGADGVERSYTSFYLVAENGVRIGIRAEGGHSKTDDAMNKQIAAKNFAALNLLADAE